MAVPAVLVGVERGDGVDHDDTGVAHGVLSGTYAHDVTVELQLVEDTGLLRVGEQFAADLQRYFVLVVRGYTVVDEGQHGVVVYLGALLGAAFELGHGLFLAVDFGPAGDTLEFLANQGDSRLGVDVTHEDNRHVLRAVPGVVELDELAQLGVLQVLGQTDDGAGIGVGAEGLLVDELAQARTAVVVVHVVLLIYGLELGLESAEHGIDEALGVNLEPLLELRRGERVVILGLVEARAGVQPFAAHVVDELRKLVADSILGSFASKFVDLQVYGVTLGLVGRSGTLIILGDDFLVDRFLFFPIEGVDCLGAFEHDVFEVVGQTGILYRVVDRAHFEGYHTEYIGFALVFPDVNRSAVPQGHYTQLLRFTGEP